MRLIKRFLSMLLLGVILGSSYFVFTVKVRAAGKDYWTDPGNYSTDWYYKNENAKEFFISTAKEFAGLSVLVNGLNDVTRVLFWKTTTIHITNNIDLSEHLWFPIGGYDDNYFEGLLDAGRYENNNYIDSYSITGLQISDSKKRNQGLFGTNSGIIKNLKLLNGSIKSLEYYNIGGIAARNMGTIQSCYVSISISGLGSKIGGIVGENSGTIENCENTGPISLDEASGIGGIAGLNRPRGVVKECSNSGSINGFYKLGGIVGTNEYKVIDSNNFGDITGTEYVGGIVGLNGKESEDKDVCIVKNCYNKGIISGKESSVGSVVGCNGNQNPENIRRGYLYEGEVIDCKSDNNDSLPLVGKFVDKWLAFVLNPIILSITAIILIAIFITVQQIIKNKKRQNL